MPEKEQPVVLAVVAHPDDIEFSCAGTLALLANQGWETHYLNLADGCCGSMDLDAEAAAKLRWEESQNAAKVLSAIPHEPLFHDLEVFVNDRSARQVTAVIRKIQPNVILTHATEDYMEDHMNAARLALYGLFCAGIPNYQTEPVTPPYQKQRALYHSLPHGLRCPADGSRVHPAFYIDIESVMPLKREALACHKSQKEWLDQTQGMDAYLETMAGFGETLGKDSGKFKYAEGFTRHLHIGLGDADYLPLENALQACLEYRA